MPTPFRSEHDSLIREALAAERAAAYAQLDPDEFEELIAATDAALEAGPSLVARGEEELALGITSVWINREAREPDSDAVLLARSLIDSGVVRVVPSLLAESEETLAKGLANAGVERGYVGGEAFRAHVARYLIASGTVRVVDATPEVQALVDEARLWPRDGINEGPLINELADAIEAAYSKGAE